MKKHFGLLMLVMTLSVWACTNTASQKDLNIKKTNVVTETATVEKIDMKKRIVSIRDSYGKVIRIHAGQEIVNLPQVRVGDIVVAEYIESVAVRMAKPGEVKEELKETVNMATPGDKPGIQEVSELTETAIILDLDKGRMTATLKYFDGDVDVVKVQDPANMNKVKVGDTIVITHTVATALSIQGKTK